MFEGLVRQALLKCLGCYIKDLQKEQLKITVWNEEMLLENVELNLDALDSLQLPFALKQGRVGKLSIKIPWKKLGWEPIIISLEDVFISTSQRHAQEWSSDAVERREFASKQVKLAAAEFAKLSRRVCDNRTGNPFVSYIAAKVLDGIQVSIRNFHVMYTDIQPDLTQVVFGLRFSSLTISKHNAVGPFGGKVRDGQVNKNVEIEAFEIYCCTHEGLVNSKGLDNIEDSNLWCTSNFEANKHNNILNPVNVSVSLSVNRSGRLYKDFPQYSINAELTCLIMSLNEVQLKQILILLDYLNINQLREKYGRYRPSSGSLSRKQDGWQKLWWHYAQESILSNVRRKLNKSSWRYLGQRLSNRRKYVKLYKTKLDCLLQEQTIEECILQELEQMEKESDIDDILSYRSAAESELQDFLSNSSISYTRTNGDNISLETSSPRSRGWLNWLSGGMLGAGGIDDSSQFSGVVSDEVVKDIYEATKFEPGDSDASDEVYTCAIKFSIHQISVTLKSVYSCQDIAKLDLSNGVIECKLWDESATIVVYTSSGRVVYPHDKRDIIRMCNTGMNQPDNGPSCRFQLDVSPMQEVELSVKVTIQPLEVAYDRDFFQNLLEFFTVIQSFEFQHGRVLSSLNGLEDVRTRLFAKAEYILSIGNKVKLDIGIFDIIVTFPWKNAVTEQHEMVLKFGSLVVTSKSNKNYLSSSPEEDSYLIESLLSSTSSSNLSTFQPEDLYSHFEVKLNNTEIQLVHCSQTAPILENFSAAITITCCIIPDESIMKQLEINVVMSSIRSHLSLPIYESVLGVIMLLDIQPSRSHDVMTNQQQLPVFHFTINAKSALVALHVDLDNDKENCSGVNFSLHDIDIWFSHKEYEECRTHVKALKLVTCGFRGENESHILLSSGSRFVSKSTVQEVMDNESSNQLNLSDDGTTSNEACFYLHYEACRSEGFVCHKCTVGLNDVDLHFYPHVIGSMVGFYDKLSSYNMSSGCSASFVDAEIPNLMPQFEFQRFGFSNFFETGSSDCGCIPLDCYPFVTIYNRGFLGNLESSLLYPISEWRKLLNVRDAKIDSTKFRSSLKSDMDAHAWSLTCCETDTSLVDINLSQLRVHLHDSSSIFGSITVPIAKSSIIISGGCMDMVCSSEGISLMSSWWTTYSDGFLWRPSLPNISPLLNIRVRNVTVGPSTYQTEVSIGIQHVCCTLPTEYLSVLIGYFSLPDWTMQPSSENSMCIDSQNGSTIAYKFEIIDSTLILPVESKDLPCLNVQIQQLYCSYLHECALSNVLQDIPADCAVSMHKVAKRNHWLNIFGRDLYLSLLLPTDSGNGDIMYDQSTGCGNFHLVAPLSADVWVRIPCETVLSSGSTCIMSRIGACRFITDDGYGYQGLEALSRVIDQFSLVADDSKSFTSDVFQFIQSKNCSKERGAVLTVESVTEFRCCVDSLQIKFNRSKKPSVSFEPVANADMKFVCSASLVNETVISLDLTFFSFGLHSVFSSVMLVQFTSTCSDSSVLDIVFSKTDQDGNELLVSLPCLELWLHSVDWTQVVDLYESYAKIFAKTATADLLSKDSCLNRGSTHVDEVDTVCPNAGQSTLLSTHIKSENTNQGSVSFTMKSQNMGITIHFPFWISEEIFRELDVADFQEERSLDFQPNILKAKHCKYIGVVAQSRSCELSIVGNKAILKSSFEKISGSVGISDGKSVKSCPLFQIEQLTLESEISWNMMEVGHVNIVILCDRLYLWCSHQVISFFQCIGSDLPETGSSQFVLRGMDIKVQLRKITLMVSDGRGSCSGPLIEILLRNFLLQANVTENTLESSFACDLEVNYNNILKVLWEPFVEPWRFEVKLLRRRDMNALLNSSNITDLQLLSTAMLNLNLTESFIECVFRTIEMAKDACQIVPDCAPENKILRNTQYTSTMCGGQFAPFILQNLTSLPLVYHVHRALFSSDVLDDTEMVDMKSVEPGVSVPIYLNETSEEQLFRRRHAHSSDRLDKTQSNGVARHFMTIKLDGTSFPSAPVSIDLVGLSYFEVDFSKASNCSMNIEENYADTSDGGFIIPVVFDVSVQRHSKLIRLYSTVVILNATSMPLELRFDIPFIVSPKILDPIYPGQEFPLPLHLAESGRMRWRPFGNSYLWSEAQSVSSLLSQEVKMGCQRFFVCYPSHPSKEPFRCCISVQDTNLLTSSQQRSKKRFIRQVTLSTPLVVNNYLPDPVSLIIESSGTTNTKLLSEVETSFHHIDPSNDLGLEFNMHRFRPSFLKFPRAETFSAVAKFSGTKFSQCETMCFDPNFDSGPIYVTVEKVMDVFSGARELFIYAPFLLYNCTGFPLVISDHEIKAAGSIIPSCYELIKEEQLQLQKDGLSLLSSEEESYAGLPKFDVLGSSSSKILTRRNSSQHKGMPTMKPVVSFISNQDRQGHTGMGPFISQSDSLSHLKNSLYLSNSMDSSSSDVGPGKVKPCIYSPHPTSGSCDLMVRVIRCLPGSVAGSMPKSLWSRPFPLAPPNGSANVLVPQSSPSSAFIVSVSSNALVGGFSGRTQAITFQPRYVISNACSKDICYKQKGTDSVFHLGIGQHSHLHWTETTRELLVSICFKEPGWQWSSSFFPDHLGDTQVKMRNYVSGALFMIRVEVQNADISISDFAMAGTLHGNTGTNLILLSDDDTGYMPYRIDNFSKERLRIYQQKCETFDTIVHPYTSCPYAWDEPCYPHRLTVEVPGERVVGSYTLDDLKECLPVHLKSTSEKPERTLLLSVYAERATKVLSIVDSSYHILKDVKDQTTSMPQGKGKQEQKTEKRISYTEKFTVAIPCVGISLISSSPQEVLFASATNLTVDFLQRVDQQKFSFQISSLQIDNQLRNTPYPVILSFNHEHRSNLINHRITDAGEQYKKKGVRQVIPVTSEPAFYLDMAKWRKRDVTLMSFEYISLRVADFRLEVEQELILSVLDFIKTISTDLQSRVLPNSDPMFHPFISDVGSIYESSGHGHSRESRLHGNNMSVLNRRNSVSIPSIIPIGAPWQQIYLLARRQRKIYVELFDLAPINITLSFSSAPWMVRNRVLTSGESLIHRGLMALADVEGARISLRKLTVAHHMASLESFQEILIRHYTKQLLHEMYKVFGSAGVIGNPMGFARSVGLGIRDFLSVPARSVLESPTGLITGMAEGTTSLVSNTVYALSDAATQFSKAAHKGIVAFTFDHQDVSRMKNQQHGAGSHSKGVINEVFEGLTGLLQSPVKEAEKHGLPGILSGIAFGITGLVARPAASILEVTGRTAQSIRNRSRLYHTGSRRYRVRLPRPLSRELPLSPYSWEEAVGTAVLMETDDSLRLKDEVLIMCKALKQAGKFVIITDELILIVSCPSLVDLGKPDFQGVPVDIEWVIESEIGLDSVIHSDSDDGVVHIVGSSSDALRQNQLPSRKGGGGGTSRTKKWDHPSTPLPLFQTNLDMTSQKDAEDLLQVLLSTRKGRSWGGRYILHKSNIQ